MSDEWVGIVVILFLLMMAAVSVLMGSRDRYDGGVVRPGTQWILPTGEVSPPMSMGDRLGDGFWDVYCDLRVRMIRNGIWTREDEKRYLREITLACGRVKDELRPSTAQQKDAGRSGTRE